jgi:hypothetical protein
VDHAPNRKEEVFETNLRLSLGECRSFYKNFLFTSGLKYFNIINAGLCVPREDEEGNQLWGPDPVHPCHKGYGQIIDYVCGKASKLHEKEARKKRQGDPLGPPAKQQNLMIQRPRWIVDVPLNVTVRGSLNRGHGTPRGFCLWRGNNFTRGRGGGQPVN